MLVLGSSKSGVLPKVSLGSNTVNPDWYLFTLSFIYISQCKMLGIKSARMGIKQEPLLSQSSPSTWEDGVMGEEQTWLPPSLSQGYPIKVDFATKVPGLSPSDI